ncbi:MAG TPA: NAD(P)H-dependent oxidoreductase [Chitinophaga sp.]|uniref:NAD(P)H-dependent oxidoreductase n=1 Tax=Chitinophaga sp. TaxID=1869181 RepID=UPI002D1E1143|nr:NAD(P)H-dependent oxidoreductase [Chitinophaga sp.]HVI47736.1 NAD(P)H-dependent oxidoreductase [Chitinophaga sp.]
MKKILIINGHPDRDRYNNALQEAYKDGALETGAIIDKVMLSDLQFDPNLRYGYRKRMELEPDLLQAWEKIQAAQHIVWVFPLWWGFTPAVLKGFIDRLFLPGLAFRYKADGIYTEKLLRGRTAHIICTMDSPVWYYKLGFRETGIRTFRTQILSYCGIKTTTTTYIAPLNQLKEQQRNKHLEKIKALGRKLK